MNFMEEKNKKGGIKMAVVAMKQLLEAGVQFSEFTAAVKPVLLTVGAGNALTCQTVT